MNISIQCKCLWTTNRMGSSGAGHCLPEIQHGMLWVCQAKGYMATLSWKAVLLSDTEKGSKVLLQSRACCGWDPLWMSAWCLPSRNRSSFSYEFQYTKGEATKDVGQRSPPIYKAHVTASGCNHWGSGLLTKVLKNKQKNASPYKALNDLT